MARERRALGKSILEKNKWLKEQLSGLFITKSLNLQAEECTFKPRVNIIIFMHLSTETVWEGEPNAAWSMGENMEMGKNTIFLSPINFFTSFSVTSRKKNWTRGENIKLFLLKLISKKLSRKKGKINTIQHDQGEKHRQRIFSPSTTPAKVEQLIAWPRREKMNTQGEKIKTQGQK
jgi:hypothetical protein